MIDCIIIVIIISSSVTIIIDNTIIQSFAHIGNNDKLQYIT